MGSPELDAIRRKVEIKQINAKDAMFLSPNYAN